MRILVSGSHGLIGSALVESLRAAGDDVVRLVRAAVKPDQHRGDRPGTPHGEQAVAWDPAAGWIDEPALEGFDAVVHLAGENLFALRWTAAKKARIRGSRVDGTKLLCAALGRLARPPRVLASASAIGYYGDRGDEELTEESPPGGGFLAQVCQDWEQATRPAAEAGVRVVLLRTGVVLASEGGALEMMTRPFRLGIGGRLGSGRQYFSWITRRDAIRAIEHATAHDAVSGPVNLVGPRPVTNRELTGALARVLRRPALLPVPAFALRAAMGELADEMLLASARVRPKRLSDSGFRHEDPQLQPALRRLLK